MHVCSSMLSNEWRWCMLEGKGCKSVPFLNKSCSLAVIPCCKAVFSCCKALLMSTSISRWNCSRSMLIALFSSTICCLSCCSCSCCCCCCCCCCSPWPSILRSKVWVKYEQGPCTTLLDTEERRIFLSVLHVPQVWLCWPWFDFLGFI